MKHCLSNFHYSFIRNESSESLDIYIDGYIVDAPTQEMYKAYFGDETSVSYKSFRDQINAAKPKTVNIYINSGGGQVADAFAIHDMIVDLQKKGTTVNTEGRGIIASAATYILMASKNSSISKNSWFMIHNVSGFAYGDVNEVEAAANMMRRFNNQIRDLYVNYTGKDASTISSWMNKETWFSGDEAVEKGFVKNVTGEATFTNTIKPEHWQFANTAVLNSYNQFTKPANTDSMKIENIQAAIENGFTALLDKLGLKDKAGDEAVKNAFKGFADGITNSLKDEVPTDEKVQEMVTNALNKIGENEAFKNAIAAATKDSVTKADLENATKDAVKKADIENLVKKQDLTNMKDEIVSAVANKAGGKSSENKNDKNEQRRSNPRNRFSGQYQAVD